MQHSFFSKLILTATAVLITSLGTVFQILAADSKHEKPADSALKRIKVVEGFDVTLFAQPPDVGYPTSVSAAPDGSAVFIAVDENGSIDQQPNRGKIIRCVDANGDGQADRFNVFARMDSPRGITWEPKGKGGILYVMHPPNLTAYYDDEGTGVSQRQADLVTGLGFNLEHRGADHTTNTCRLGIDGWIYIACGDYGAVNAKGKDGRSLNVKGGGVVRVRTDGTGLESVSVGQRNIYDVAVSPMLDLFTRDNTNDGDGWDVRLSHVVPGAHYGYPSLFRNFKSDTMDPIAEYGGGSPTGALWMDEPDYPGDWGGGLYTVEWGQNAIYHHPMTPNGASWKPDQKRLIKVTRPTDVDCDGIGNLYVTSWEGATFTYDGPNAGYVLRITPKERRTTAFPDVPNLGDEALVTVLNSKSATWRMAAQREILYRGPRSGVAEKLVQLANSEVPIAARVAAIFTLKQLMGEKSHAALLALVKQDDLREFSLKALADDIRLASKIPIEPFIAALRDANPRVRLQAAIGLGRLNKTEAASSMLPLTADSDPVVSHVTARYLAALKAVDSCLGALDGQDEKVKPGALRVLYRVYEPKVVDGLIQRLATVKQPELRKGILNALCRLQQREAPYEFSKWWGTRPDTSGPIYKGEKWAGSDKIEVTLKKELDTVSEDQARGLIADMYRCKVNFPGMIELMLAKAGADTAGKLTAVEGMFSSENKLPRQAIAALQDTARSEKENPELRARALRLLQRGSEHALDAVVDAFALLVGRELQHPELTAAFEEFTRDSKNGWQVGAFSKIAEGKDGVRRELAQMVLVNITTNKLVGRDEKDAARKAVEKLWTRPEFAIGLLNAIARTGAREYADAVRAHLKSPDNAIAESALATYQKLGLKDADASTTAVIGMMKYEDVLAEVMKTKGEVAHGREIFLRQGCIACHTTSAAEPPKGPMLAAVAKIYGRSELCESILLPSAKMAQGFESQWFETRKGERIEGFVTREGGDSVDVRNIAGQSVKLEVSEIKSRGKRDASIMPEGLVNNLTPAELADILTFLESLKGS